MASLTAINGTEFADIVMGKRTTCKTVSLWACGSCGWQACIPCSKPVLKGQDYCYVQDIVITAIVNLHSRLHSEN